MAARSLNCFSRVPRPFSFKIPPGCCRITLSPCRSVLCSACLRASVVGGGGGLERAEHARFPCSPSSASLPTPEAWSAPGQSTAHSLSTPVGHSRESSFLYIFSIHARERKERVADDRCGVPVSDPGRDRGRLPWEGVLLSAVPRLFLLSNPFLLFSLQTTHSVSVCYQTPSLILWLSSSSPLHSPHFPESMEMFLDENRFPVAANNLLFHHQQLDKSRKRRHSDQDFSDVGFCSLMVGYGCAPSSQQIVQVPENREGGGGRPTPACLQAMFLARVLGYAPRRKQIWGGRERQNKVAPWGGN